MREDMSKIIVERPRRGGWGASRGRALPLDHLPQRQGMRRAHSDRKFLNENLAPLRRYLERQVGRHWDSVYSEIAQHLRPTSTVQQHVRDHLPDLVEIKPRPAHRWPKPLFVDPTDGVLKRREQPARRRSRLTQGAPDRIRLADDRELRRIAGLWFLVTLSPVPAAVYHDGRLMTPPVLDMVSRTVIPAGPECDGPSAWVRYQTDYPDRYFATAKRSLSQAMLRRYRLRNSPDAP